MSRLSFSPRKLRLARRDRSMESVAKAIGTSRFTLSKWERGKAEPRASELARVAALFNRRLDYFFESAA